jgi:hypothetical protein
LKIDGGIKVFNNKQKLKQYIPPSQHYRRFCKEFYTQKMKTNKTTKGWEVFCSGEEQTSTQRITLNWVHTFKSLNNKKQLNGRNNYVPINVNPEC